LVFVGNTRESRSPRAPYFPYDERIEIARPLLLLVCLFVGPALAGELSDASKRVAAELARPVTIHAFFSGAPPEFRALEQGVLDLLDRYGALGKIDVRRHDPYLGGEAERLAGRYNVEPTILNVFKRRVTEAHRSRPERSERVRPAPSECSVCREGACPGRRPQVE
jgi:hypothetical protein